MAMHILDLDRETRMIVFLALSIVKWPEHEKIFLARLPAAVDAWEGKHADEVREVLLEALTSKRGD